MQFNPNEVLGGALAEGLKIVGGLAFAWLLLKIMTLWGSLENQKATPWVAVVALAALLLGLFPFVRPSPPEVITLSGRTIGSHGIVKSKSDPEWFENTCERGDKIDPIKYPCWVDVPDSEGFNLCTISTIIVDATLKRGDPVDAYCVVPGSSTFSVVGTLAA
jgi:hypothetical protein